MVEGFKVYIAPRLPVGAALVPNDEVELGPPTVLTLDRDLAIIERIARAVMETKKVCFAPPQCVLVGWKSYICAVWEAKQRMTSPVATAYYDDSFYVAGCKVYCDPREEHSVTALPPTSGVGTPFFRAVST